MFFNVLIEDNPQPTNLLKCQLGEGEVWPITMLLECCMEGDKRMNIVETLTQNYLTAFPILLHGSFWYWVKTQLHNPIYFEGSPKAFDGVTNYLHHQIFSLILLSLAHRSCFFQLILRRQRNVIFLSADVKWREIFWKVFELLKLAYYQSRGACAKWRKTGWQSLKQS